MVSTIEERRAKIKKWKNILVGDRYQFGKRPKSILPEGMNYTREEWNDIGFALSRPTINIIWRL